MSFTKLSLSEPLQRAVRTSGYKSPTPVQSRVIPAILSGSDVMAAAQTGTGKTAGFTLPMLEKLSQNQPAKNNHIRALILTPTRELAAQVQNSVFIYSKYLQLRSTAIFGGVKINPQITTLRRGIDILVATPGRLLDLYQQKAVHFDQIEMLVLDEADRILDMGFIDDIKKIMQLLPKSRQNLMFSATFSQEIRKLATKITNNPVEIDVSPKNSTVEKISQKIHPVDKSRKTALLIHLIKTQNWYQALVFARTKRGSDQLVKQLTNAEINADCIHGDKSQYQRMKILRDFKQNKTQVLVATDIAARGIDIEKLSHVVNFDLPYTPEDYIHRIGRTGRAGASGDAISLVSADEIKQLYGIEQLIKAKIEREEITGFTPKHALPMPRSPKAGHRKYSSPNFDNKKPGQKPWNKSKQKTDEKPWNKSKQKTDEKPWNKSKQKTDEKPWNKFKQKTDEKPGQKTGEKPWNKFKQKTDGKPGQKTGEKPWNKFKQKTDEKPGQKTGEKPWNKFKQKTDEKPEQKTGKKPEQKFKQKPRPNSENNLRHNTNASSIKSPNVKSSKKSNQRNRQNAILPA